jgi:septal ring factor EnvC (AmiA/AmiB activator)
MYKEVIAFNTKLLTLLELGIGGALIYKSRRSRKLSNENSLKTKRELVNVDEDLMKMNIARQNIQTQIDELTLKLNDIREGRINIPVEIEGQSNLEEQIARLQMELTELSDVEITYGEESSESEDFGGLA